ncbi:MAG: small-conductance mechanosensitive channel [Gammaproteobacteria bacterium]|jgi:potassium efflux system protein|nr:small-conductance mechanosensitive channel [Gammaproteobacteria bacterium]
MKNLRLLLISFFFFWGFSATAFANSDNEDILSSKMIDFTAKATEIDLQNAELSLAQVNQSIKNIRQNLRDYHEQMAALKIAPPDSSLQSRITLLSSKIQNQQAFLRLAQLRQTTLKKTIETLQSQLETEQKRLKTIADEEQRQARIAREKLVQGNIQQLANEQNYWLNKISSLNQLLNTNAQDKRNYTDILQQIFVAEESSNLTQFKISLLHINNNIQNIAGSINELASAAELNEQKQALSDNVNDLEQTQDILQRKIGLLQQREELLKRHHDTNSADLNTINQVQQFLSEYQELLNDVTNLISQAAHQEEKATTLLAKALARRQGLPGFNLQDWTSLGQGLAQTIILTYQISIASLRDIFYNSEQMDLFKKIQVGILIVLSVIAYTLIRIGCQVIRKKLSSTPTNILYQFIDGAIRIFSAHLWYIISFAAAIIFLNIINIANQVTDIIFHAGSTVLVYSIALMVTRISLYQNAANHTGDDVKLYYRLCWLFSFGFIIAFFMMLSKSLNNSFVAQDLFERLFMLFIFITSILLLKAWKVVPEIIIPFIHPQKSYLIRVTRLLGMLFPLIILSNAVIGLIGFVDLAWTISKYEGLFLLVVVMYLIFRGLMNDGLNYLVANVIRLRSGWIISQAFLKPISIWLHIFLFIAGVYFLLCLYDLNHQAFIINFFYKALYFPLIKLSKHNLSIFLIIKATIVASIFIWATKWAREFSYRKLYKNIADKGARNSLAIFTQYGVCTLGIVATLETIQIDLTTIVYVISALAVGIGFGLRDLANNFVSGLLILIERPMRRGDTVTIGEYEGSVLNIGMRAITILSSDNREIVVPNAEVFSKIFINWTHRDDIIRCETSIKIRWQEDPHKLKHEIEQVMLNTQGVLPKPIPEAILKGMSEGLLEFELRFYIDYRITDSRMVMKSNVLFNIWDKFSELGIHPPYPAHRVLLNDA